MRKRARFTAEKYREDFAGLTHKIVDRENGATVDEAMSEEDARDLAHALNLLWEEYAGDRIRRS